MEVAAKQGVSESRVCQKHRSALSDLKQVLLGKQMATGVKSKKNHSLETRARAIELYHQVGKHAAAEKMNIPAQTIYGWARAASVEKKPKLPKAGKPEVTTAEKHQQTSVCDHDEIIAKLTKQNKMLRILLSDLLLEYETA